MSDSDISLPDPLVEQRRQTLQRMRFLATALLGIATLTFILTSWLQARWPWLAFVRAFAEASMIGACADWFAVVALFRHPLGLPIPHTAIVPQHKPRIAEAFGRFVTNNFLAPAQVTSRLENMDMAGWVARWLQQPENARLVALRSRSLLPTILETTGDTHIRQVCESLIRTGIDSVAAAPLVARLLSILMKHNYQEVAFDWALTQGHRFLDEHHEGIRQKIASGNQWMPGWVDNKLSDAFLGELHTTLVAAEAPQHPWRKEMRNELRRLIDRLANDPELMEQGEVIKANFLDESVIRGYFDWLGDETQARIREELEKPEGALTQGITDALSGLGAWLAQEERVCAHLNQWAQQLVMNTLIPNRSEVGHFVTDIVHRWDTKTLVDKLELQVGRDLQYIRINGTLVGGLIGLLIYSATRLVE